MELVDAAGTNGKLAEYLRLQRKNLTNWVCRLENRGCSVTKKAIDKYARAFLPKGKISRAICSNCELRESQGEREPHLGKKEESGREHGEERMDSTVKKGGFQREEGGHAKRTVLGENIGR